MLYLELKQKIKLWNY